MAPRSGSQNRGPDVHSDNWRRETNRRANDVQLSIVSLDPVLDTILNSTDPLVQNWTIWPSAETRKDADDLKTSSTEVRLAPAPRPE